MSFWKDYSIDYVKRNKATSISVLAAAFITSLLLSLLCGVFYNIWKDDIQLIRGKEGGWHGKIKAALSAEDIARIRNHPEIKEVDIAEGKETGAVLLTFYHVRQVYKRLPEIAEQIGIRGTSQIEYHDSLLARYFVYAKGHTPPPIVFVYLGTLVTASVSLILIIHNAFGVSMLARLQQLAILQSIGATPGQLRSALVNEALMLCLIPILTGIFAGYGLCYLFITLMRKMVQSVRSIELVFQYHPGILVFSFVVSVLTVWFSVLIPARRMSRLGPLEAIRYESRQAVPRRKSFFLISHLLGTEGELARKSLYTRREAFRTATISLTLSFLVFSAFLNLEAISYLSTQHSFFERYKHVWDLMITLQGPEEAIQQELLTEIRALPEVRSVISYQKAATFTVIDRSLLSKELLELGGPQALKNTGIQYDGKQYRVETPLIILDDLSFEQYCHGIGGSPEELVCASSQNAVVINTIWDNIHSNRRSKRQIPFLQSRTGMSLQLHSYEKGTSSLESAEIKIMAETDQLPGIRESLEDHSLSLVLPSAVYKGLSIALPTEEVHYTILAKSDQGIEALENRIRESIADTAKYKLDNRLVKEKENVRFRRVYKGVIGSLTGLLISIGLANVLSNALGLCYQRKREFSRYISVGMTPGGVLRLLLLEGSILAIRPILIGLLVNLPIVALSLKASHIPIGEFIQRLPAAPVLIVAAIIVVVVMTAYYIGGRRLSRINLVEALKDDTLTG